ncbi:hypothetical protein Gotur_011424, partial [Gossypium turneri]
MQAWECTPGKEMAWNILSLFTTSGMLFLEVSLLAFLLQGNHASGLQALTQTFVISGLIVGLDLLLKEEDMHLENVYYSEMKDAGFFDADWDSDCKISAQTDDGSMSEYTDIAVGTNPI